MGAITLQLGSPHRRGELGYWTGMPFWNRGPTTEAAIRVAAHGFFDRDLYRIQATCLPGNIGSVRVLEKTGLREEGTMRGYVLKWGAFEDRAMYGVLRTDVC